MTTSLPRLRQEFGDGKSATSAFTVVPALLLEQSLATYGDALGSRAAEAATVCGVDYGSRLSRLGRGNGAAMTGKSMHSFVGPHRHVGDDRHAEVFWLDFRRGRRGKSHRRGENAAAKTLLAASCPVLQGVSKNVS